MNMKLLNIIKLIGPTFITNRFNNIVSTYSFICLIVFLEAFTPNINAQTAGDYYHSYEENVAQGNYEAAYKAIVHCNKLVGNSPLTTTIIGVMRLQGKGVPKDTVRAYIDGFSLAAYCIDFKSKESRDKSDKMYEGMSNVGSVDMKEIHNRIKESRKEEDMQYQTYLTLSDSHTDILTAFAARWNACYGMVSLDASLISGDLEQRFAEASGVIEEVEISIPLTGDAYSEYLLGKIWYEGHTGMKDRQKGIDLFEQAASKGCISALTYLGDIMKKKGDINKAKEYWRKAAQEEVKPLILPNKQNVTYFASPNIDIYDVKVMRERAINNLKTN